MMRSEQALFKKKLKESTDPKDSEHDPYVPFK